MIIIRRAKKNDISAIKSLVESYSQYLMSEIPSIYRFFVAVDEDKIVGLLCAGYLLKKDC